MAVLAEGADEVRAIGAQGCFRAIGSGEDGHGVAADVGVDSAPLPTAQNSAEYPVGVAQLREVPDKREHDAIGAVHPRSWPGFEVAQVGTAERHAGAFAGAHISDAAVLASAISISFDKV